MPKAEYDWESGRPAALEPHSTAKHTILRKYVEEYIRILTADPRQPDFRIRLIDGFAGGGEYLVEGQREIHDGSPFVLINAVKAGEFRANESRKKAISVDASFVFVEKNRANFLYLEDALSRRLDAKTRAKVTPIQGAFEDHLDSIIRDVQTTKGRKPRCIFVLDQYGYSDVPIEMIAKIMRELPRSEVFLTLAFDWIGAYARGAKARAIRIEKSLHIAPHLQGFADGSRGLEEIADLPQGDEIATMRYIQRLLHVGFATQGGAMCYTPFFITSRGSNRSYWFLHLANNARANDVVKELHWTVKNHFVHYGGSGLMMLGYDPARPVDDTQQQAFGFDKSARDQTIETLLEQLPRRIREKFPRGVSFGDLYASVCNETPASMDILREPIDCLCREGELEKRGADGEERALDTKIKDGDRILLPAQRTFSFSRKA